MKKILIVLILILATVFGYGQRKLKKLEVKEEGFNVKISFTPIVDELEYKGLSIKIIPVFCSSVKGIMLLLKSVRD